MPFPCKIPNQIMSGFIDIIPVGAGLETNICPERITLIQNPPFPTFYATSRFLCFGRLPIFWTAN